VQEDFVLLYHRTSGKLAGAPDITMGRAMGQLSEQFMVVYHSFILPQDNSKKEPPGKYKLQTIIYGLGKDADAVGALLSTYDLFLQHPRDSDPAKLYSNPHYLSRPGRNMDIPQYTTTAGIDTCPDDSVLDEVGHARILQIFDSAQGPQKFLNPQIAAGLKTSLKDYQILALAMMFEKENGVVEGANFPSLWRVRDFSGKKRYYNVVTKAFEEQGAELRQGGLLADDMGLGKTLTTLAFIASSNAASNSSKSHNADGSWRQLMSLVVAPKTAIPVWEEQIQKHFESDTLRLFVYHGMARKTSNLASLNHHIVITTYETLSTEWSRHAERPLLSHLWHRVILDEAHVIRNSNSAKHRAVCDLKAHHRWCLTGTPVQNRIEDYGAILKFLRISPFLSKHKFNHYIANPIQSGRDEGFETLKTLVKATSLRRTKKSELKQCDLPRRQAILQSLVLGTREKGIYDFFKKRAANIVFDLDGGVGNSKHLGNILPTLTKLRQICNHSTGFLPRAMLAAAESRNETSLYDVELQQDRCDNCHLMFAEIQDIDLTEQNLPCSHSLCQTCLRVAQNDENGEAAGGSVCPVCSNARSPSDHTSLGAVAVFGKAIEAWMEPSTKIIALLQNLRQDRSASTEDPFKR
jgi:SWI/SNF-related matrix-associated actin-dependent regulator of chromatin subfamily A3